MNKRAVVVGGGAAGLNCALELSDKGLQTVLVSEEELHCKTERLHKALDNKVEALGINLRVFLRDSDVRFLNTEFTGFRPEEKAVNTDEEKLEYDFLVLAQRGVPHQEFNQEYTGDFYSPERAKAASENIGEKVGVIGAGRKGVETAGYLEERGIETTVLERKTRPLPKENNEASEKTVSEFNKLGVSFRGGAEIKEITSYGVELEEGTELEFDTLIWCGGLEAPHKVQKSFECGPEGIEVNRGLSSTDFEGVYAAQACADIGKSSFFDNVRQGKVIANNITSESDILEEYSSKERKIIGINGKGLLIEGEKVFFNRLAGFYPRYRDMKYRLRLKLKEMFQ